MVIFMPKVDADAEAKMKAATTDRAMTRAARLRVVAVVASFIPDPYSIVKRSASFHAGNLSLNSLSKFRSSAEVIIPG